MSDKMLNAHFTFNEDMRIWHKPTETDFGYSDGDAAEKEIFRAIKACQDRSTHSDELRSQQKDWVSTYHLSALRSNLLRPLENSLLKNARVLELGCGCGAVTRYLGEAAPEVIAVEGSAQRASIAALRCEGMENVTVIAETIENIPEAIGKFDVVTIIGVLEYARIYGGGKGAELRLLEKARSFLRPGGVLILAIENKLGLKYFAGVPEDHLGIPWAGVMGTYTQDSVATYSRKELNALLTQAGFGSRQQFISFPDYKLPITVIHPEGLACEQDVFRQSSLMTTRTRPYENNPLFNTRQTWESICNAGLLPEMADSLCFTAVNDQQEAQSPAPAIWEENILASHYGFPSEKQYTKEVQIKRQADGLYTTRRPLFDMPQKDTFLLQQQLQNEPYIKGSLLIEHMRCTMLQPGWTIDSLAKTIKAWAEWIASHKNPETGKVPFYLIDAAPFNIVVQNDNTLVYIDQEWNSGQIDSLHIQSVLLRTLINTLYMIGSVAQPDRQTPLGHLDLVTALINQLGFAFTENDAEIIEQAFSLERILGIQVHPFKELKSLRISTILPYNTLEETQARLNQIHASYSWKMTKPFRKLYKFLKKIRISKRSKHRQNAHSILPAASK